MIDNFKKYDITENNMGQFSIELSPMSNTIRFSVKSDNCLYAYVVGDFNNWEISDECKLQWQLDINDGILKMMKDIKFENGLKNGSYRYKFILINREGNEIWIDNPSEGRIGYQFYWNNIETSLQIVTSNCFISPDIPVELVGKLIEIYDRVSFPKVNWSIEGNINDAYIKDNFLHINDSIKDYQDIIIVGETEDKKYTAKKKITVNKSLPNEKLVHFLTDDNRYYGSDFIWNCWAFENGRDPKEIALDIVTDFGMSAFIPYSNFIIRRKQWGANWVNDWAEQTCTFNSESNNVYIVYGTSIAYSSLRDALISARSQIKFAVMDDDRKIKAYLTREPLLGITFDLYINGEKIEDITHIVKGLEVIITNIPKNINANDLVVITPSNMFSPCKVKMRNYLDKYYYSKEMGVQYLPKDIIFRLWAPTAYKVEVAFYDTYNSLNTKPLILEEMYYDNKSGTHFLALNRKDYYEKYYLYKLYFREVDSTGKSTDKITFAVDPYAQAVGVNGDKGYLIDLNDPKVKPDDWHLDKSPDMYKKTDAILYEMHIRDFTIDKNSGVKDQFKGTYLGACEENTYYYDKFLKRKVSTGLSHLIELGVTHVHLMPIFDFGSVDERIKNNKYNRNWGYDPKNYNVPEGSYSTNPFNPLSRIYECREMIQKFHKNGIRVVMDMVYNHMINTSNMDNIVPGYYFRTDYLGRYTNGSGCGNEICTERPMVKKFILDSCSHWIKNYHIDGMRFDLMELMDINTTKEIVRKTAKYDKNFLIYGEPWKGGDSPVKNGTYKGSQRNENFSIFNDTFRDALRGDNNPSKGFINGDQYNPFKAWAVIEGLKGSIYTIACNPSESINYVEAHDNYCIWDQIEKSQNIQLSHGNYRNNIPVNPLDNYNVRQNTLGLSFLLTSQGIPFFQSGSEFLRTKQGDHNSYKSSDEINSVKWEDKSKFLNVFNYYKGLIDIRKKFNCLKFESADDIKNNINIYFPHNNDSSGVIISHIKDIEVKGRELYIIYNGSGIDGYNVNSYICLNNDKRWRVIANDSESGLNTILNINNFNIPLLRSYSILILEGNN